MKILSQTGNTQRVYDAILMRPVDGGIKCQVPLGGKPNRRSFEIAADAELVAFLANVIARETAQTGIVVRSLAGADQSDYVLAQHSGDHVQVWAPGEEGANRKYGFSAEVYGLQTAASGE